MPADSAPPGRSALIVVHGVALLGALADRVAERAGGSGARATVVVPAIPASRPRDWLDASADPVEAEHAMRGAVGALRERGLLASGRLGDADPFSAIDEAIAAAMPDVIILATGKAARVADVERAVWRARRRVAVPVVHVDAAIAGITETLGLLYPCEPARGDRLVGGESFASCCGAEVLLVDRPVESLILDERVGLVSLEVPAELARRHEVARGEQRERRYLIPTGELDGQARVVGQRI